MRVSIAIALLVTVAACGDARKDRIAFDGHFFRTSVKKGEDRRNFTVTSKPASASFEGARQAAQYEAFTYCINEYGSSKIRWTVGPKQDPASYRIVNDTLTLSGTCPG